MAAIITSDVTEVCPDITSVPAAILAWVNGPGTNVCVFDGEDGPTTKLFRIYLAAHLASSLPANGGSGGGAVGPVQSETEGGISKSYGALAQNSQTLSALQSTKYGIQASLLAKIYAGGAWLAM